MFEKAVPRQDVTIPVGLLFFFSYVGYDILLLLDSMRAVLQIGRSLVRSQLVSLEFFIDIKSFRSHYGPEVDSASNRNEYQSISWG